MDDYTQLLSTDAETLSPDDDRYEDELLRIVRSFRTFSKALTQFICRNGFNGQPDNTEEKLLFLKQRFKAAGIPVPREINGWFTNGKSVRRDTAFQICFAFSLNVEQTDEFFRKVYLERSFDCHSIREAVYYYCIRNGLKYQKAAELISHFPKEMKGQITEGREVLYTGTIIDFINSCKNEDELTAFLNEHIEQFEYNNATAKKHIQSLWNVISCENGLAYREGVFLAQAYNMNHGDEDNYVTSPNKGASTWTIYSQILGLDNHQSDILKANRSIKPLLVNNDLLSPLAEASFPDRDGIEKITNSQHVSHERIRKLLILLEFYTYWARLVVEKKNELYEADKTDSERCLDRINSYLLDCGYPELYAGNPYDWIFLWALNDNNPLPAFRYYMREIYAAKQEAYE